MLEWVLNSPRNIPENEVIPTDTDTSSNSLFLADCANTILNGEREIIKIMKC